MYVRDCRVDCKSTVDCVLIRVSVYSVHMLRGRRLDKKGGWNITIKVMWEDLPKMLDAVMGIQYLLVLESAFLFKETKYI